MLGTFLDRRQLRRTATQSAGPAASKMILSHYVGGFPALSGGELSKRIAKEQVPNVEPVSGFSWGSSGDAVYEKGDPSTGVHREYTIFETFDQEESGAVSYDLDIRGAIEAGFDGFTIHM